jgi:hypothetical protein
MGLESGEFGAKRTILDMLQLHGSGRRTVTKLQELHVHYEINKTNAAVIVDGNVMVRASPQLSYKDFCKYISDQVNGFFTSAKHVIVVFDEPEAMTVAKKEEQAHRDAQRKKREIITSRDLLHLPQTDAYNEDDIKDCPNIHDLIENRPTRIRLMDMVFCNIMKEARRVKSQQLAMLGMAMTSLTFDGIDPRGDSRGHHEVRVPGIMSTEPKMQEMLHREKPIGEGDLKLVAVEQAIDRHRWEEDSPVASVRMVLHWTIDTDSLMINLVAEAERDSRGVKDLISLLCLREPGRKRKGEDHFTPAHYQVVDMQSFYKAAMLLFFKEDSPQVRKLGREAVALLAMSMAACGCDFTGKNQIKGLRANEMFCTLAKVIDEDPTILPSMRGAWSGDIKETLKTCNVLKHVLGVYGRMMGEGAHKVPVMLSAESYTGSVSKVRQKYALDIQSASDEGLLRAAWVCGYWHQCEFKELGQFGFPY